METRPDTHPAPGVLQAFGLGKLDDAAAEMVLDHLEACSECCKEVAAQSGDTFLDRLRQAHRPSNTPAPAGSLSDTARRLRAGGSAPTGPYVGSSVAPELASHPQYEILRELGRGGMGVVYLARNRLMARLEVLKVVNKDMLERSGGKERFLREIQSAAMLNHPNVVAAYSALPVGELLVFAMEYIDGEDLAKLVKERGPLPVLHACYYAQQVAMGLQHAFEKKMVHRDIKPQNLILAREGKKHTIKVLDFGLAKVKRETGEDSELTGTGKMLGTPDYIAPEQTLDATSADTRADIYSLGCTMYFLLAGHAPFRGKSLYEILQAHQMMQARPLNLERPEAPVELAAVVAKMMAKDPAKRYQTPVEVAQALMPFIKPGTKSAPTAGASHYPSLGEPTAAKSLEQVYAQDAPPPPRRRASSPSPMRLDTLTPSSTTSIKSGQSGDIGKRPRAKPAGRKKWLIGSAALCVMLIGLVSLWAGGVLRVKTPNGTIVIEHVPADADVQVEGQAVTLTRNGEVVTVTAVPEGPHRLKVVRDGKEFWSTDVTVNFGGDPVRLTCLRKDTFPDKIQPGSGSSKSPDPQSARPGEDEFTNTIGMKMVRIAPDAFEMGFDKNQHTDPSEEAPRRRSVTIARPFYLATYKTTQAEFENVMGRNPSWFCPFGGGKDKVSGLDTSRFPVECATYFDAIEFCIKLTKRESRGLRPCYDIREIRRDSNGSITAAMVTPLSDGTGYRLPSEAEWEYCARARSTTEFSFGDDPAHLEDYAWFGQDNTKGRIYPVGMKRPNPWKLYDMGGLLWEWCEDNWHGDYQGAPEDGGAWAEGGDRDRRVCRGGTWFNNWWVCRCAYRRGFKPGLPGFGLGFRVVLVAADADAPPTGAFPPENVPSKPETARVAPTPASRSRPDLRWIEAFDGKSWTGWSRTRANTTSWALTDATIIAIGTGRPGAGSQIYISQEFTDCVIKAKVSGTLSGIMFRGAEHENSYKGYYVSVDWRDAGTLSEFVPARAPGWRLLSPAKKTDLREGEIFDIEIQVEGIVIIVSVNGQEVVRCQETAQLYAAGKVALRCNKDGKLTVKRFQIGLVAKNR
jgi:serine/threonine protein kinase/formylglycine-generating enzyme required for sulfatase activity